MARVALITGAAKGLGLELGKTLAQDGFHVILTGRGQARLEELANQIRNSTKNQNVSGYNLDVASVDSIKQLFQSLTNKGIKIDVLVNNAAVADNPDVKISARELLTINYYGVINVSRILSPLLTVDAKIVNVSSAGGLLAFQSAELQAKLNSQLTEQGLNQLVESFISQHEKDGTFSGFQSPIERAYLYVASKVFLNTVFRYVLVNEVGPNQTASIIHPGWVKTDMGGVEAPLSLAEGIVTAHYLITKVPFGRSEQYHGKFLNEKHEVWSY